MISAVTIRSPTLDTRTTGSTGEQKIISISEK